jgi:hydrogenase maturation protein HypF
MLLEGLAATAVAAARLPRCPVGGDLELDLRPLAVLLADATEPAQAAADFHAGLALALADWVAAAAAVTGLTAVACGGGCFQNELLSRRLRTELAARRITMLEAVAVPPNDGAVSLGQCWVAQRTGS